MTRAALPHVLARGEGRIVNVASIIGKWANPQLAAYSARRAASSPSPGRWRGRWRRQGCSSTRSPPRRSTPASPPGRRTSSVPATCRGSRWAHGYRRGTSPRPSRGSPRPSARSRPAPSSTVRRARELLTCPRPLVSTGDRRAADRLARGSAAPHRLGGSSQRGLQRRGVRPAPRRGRAGRAGRALRSLAERLGMPLVHDEEHDLWALGPDSLGGPRADDRGRAGPRPTGLRRKAVRALVSARPQGRAEGLGVVVRLPLRPARVAGAAVGTPAARAGGRGGRARHRPGGGEAVRSGGAPEHPSLVDRTHLVNELFGIVNIPDSVWIDEQGAIVRPVEAAHLRESALKRGEFDPSTLPPRMRELARRVTRDIDCTSARCATGPRKARRARGRAARGGRPPDTPLVGRASSGRVLRARAAPARAGEVEAAQAHWRETHRLAP